MFGLKILTVGMAIAMDVGAGQHAVGYPSPPGSSLGAPNDQLTIVKKASIMGFGRNRPR